MSCPSCLADASASSEADQQTAKDHLEVFDTIALSYDVRAIQNWYKAELKTARS
jgi:hypothetical protein